LYWKVVHYFKTYPKFRPRTWDTITVPEIRLEGKWLEGLGFKKGYKIQVQENKNKLAIALIKDTEKG